MFYLQNLKMFKVNKNHQRHKIRHSVFPQNSIEMYMKKKMYYHTYHDKNNDDSNSNEQ